MCLHTVIHFLGSLDNIKYILVGNCRTVYNGEINKRSHTFPYCIGKMLYSFLALVIHDIPLIDKYHKSLLVLQNETIDIHILRLYATLAINDKHTYI